MPDLVDNAGVREQARREQERRDAVNELGTLSKCLAGYLGCFDDNKTHATPDSELIKLLERGCKSALRRLALDANGSSLRPETIPLFFAKVGDIADHRLESGIDATVLDVLAGVDRRYLAVRREIVDGKDLAEHEQWNRVAAIMLHQAADCLLLYEAASAQAKTKEPKSVRKVTKK